VNSSTEGKRSVPATPQGGPHGEHGEHGEIEAPELFGQYLLYESLGHGAMASVRRGVLCRDAGFRRVVALKQLHAHLAKIPEMVELFAREARLGSYLRHANIAQTFDFGSVDGAYFIAMELVRGPTLAQLSRQCAGAAGPIPMGIVVGILTQLCDAFDYIRSARDPQGQPLHLAHCDVSPTNVVISNTGYVKLIDFGISRAGSRPVAETGMLRRRLAYVAPEYAAGKLDARSDLFSLGVIGYELIANQPLFAGSGDELRRVREMAIPPLSRAGPVPHALQDVIMTALQRDPERRWQTAAEMRSALSDVARGLAVHIGPPQIASWIGWAFSQRMRPDALTPLVVVPAVARSTASPAVVAAMAATVILTPATGTSRAASEGGSAFQDAPTTLHPRAEKPTELPSVRPARPRRARLPSVTLPLSRTSSRELTRRFQRPGSSRRWPAGGAATGAEPLRRKLAHTVPRGLRKADRLRATRTAGADRSGAVRPRSAAAPIAAIRVAPPAVQSSPPVAPPEPSMSVSTARAGAVPRTSEPLRAGAPTAAVQAPAAPAAASATAGRTSGSATTIASGATARTPGAQRAGAGLPAASPRPRATHAAGAARSTLETTGVVVVAASRRPGRGGPARERMRTRVVRLHRRLFRSVLPAVFAILAALAAFALAYRWLL
jgi:serine/threonine protein kinase